jgi:hypothetical protein
MMHDEGVVIANDISYPRAKAMSQNVERMGRGNIIVASNDFVFSHIHFHNTFDKIIVDAPCSGSAMMRKNPEEKADWRYEKVKSNAKKQLEILELAYDMLKEGGTFPIAPAPSLTKKTKRRFSLSKPSIRRSFWSISQDPSFYRASELPEAVHLFPSHFEGEGQFICLFKKPGTSSFAKKVSQRPLQGFPRRIWLKRPLERDDAQKFYSLIPIFRCLPPQHPPLWGQALRDARNLHPRPPLSPLPDPGVFDADFFGNAKAYIHGDTFPIR